MPTYTVVAHKDGRVQLLTKDQLDERTPADKKNEKVLGKFAAENSSEAWRLMATENPSLDVDKHQLTVQVGQDADADKQKRELHTKVMEKAVGDLKVPKGSDPDAYSDEAHKARGEMTPKEMAERTQAEENAKPRFTDQQRADQMRPAAARSFSTSESTKADSAKSSSTRQTGEGGAADSGSPNQASPAPSKGSDKP